MLHLAATANLTQRAPDRRKSTAAGDAGAVCAEHV